MSEKWTDIVLADIDGPRVLNNGGKVWSLLWVGGRRCDTFSERAEATLRPLIGTPLKEVEVEDTGRTFRDQKVYKFLRAPGVYEPSSSEKGRGGGGGGGGRRKSPEEEREERASIEGQKAMMHAVELYGYTSQYVDELQTTEGALSFVERASETLARAIRTGAAAALDAMKVSGPGSRSQGTGRRSSAQGASPEASGSNGAPSRQAAGVPTPGSDTSPHPELWSRAVEVYGDPQAVQKAYKDQFSKPPAIAQMEADELTHLIEIAGEQVG